MDLKTIAGYEKELEKLKLLNRGLVSQNKFLRDNLEKYTNIAALSDTLFFRLVRYGFKIINKIKWIFKRVFRKVGRIIRGVFNGK